MSALRQRSGAIVLALVLVGLVISVATGEAGIYRDLAGPLRTTGAYAYGGQIGVTMAPDGGEMMAAVLPNGDWLSAELWPHPAHFDHGVIKPA